MTAPEAASRSRRLPLVIGIGLVAVGLITAAVLGGSSSNEGPPLSPTSTATDGTKALVLLLQSFGTEVDVTQAAQPPERSVALVLRDDFTDEEHVAVRNWVRRGGTLVVADPSSSFAPDGKDVRFTQQLTRAVCNIPQLDDVNQLVVGTTDLSSSVLFTVSRGDQSCFGNREGAYVVRRTQSEGSIVAIGGPDPFTNELIAKSDNSVLAMRLLAPAPNQPLTIFDPNRPGHGRTSLLDLVAPRVTQFLVELAVALLVYVLFRMRRLGRPVLEPQPVDIAGSGLVKAVGSLQHRSASYERARAVLQDDTRRRLAERYGLPVQASATVVADAVAAHTRIDRDTVMAALTQPFTGDDDALLALVHQLDDIREEVLDGRG